MKGGQARNDYLITGFSFFLKKITHKKHIAM